jgi:signal transduction histidine kinase
MSTLKQAIVRHWPRLRLRTIILGILVLVAALPGIGALYLRVYENALVRQTEAEVRALGVALAQLVELQAPSQGGALHLHAATAPRPHRVAKIDLQSVGISQDIWPVTDVTTRPDPHTAAIASQLAPALENIQRQTGIAIMLLDPQGVIVYGNWQGARFDQPQEIAIALSGSPATLLRHDARNPPPWFVALFSRAAGTRLIHTEPIVVAGKIIGVVRTSKPPMDVFGGIYLDFGKIILGVVLIFATLVLLSITLARAIVGPIERLSAAAPGIATGRGRVPANPSLAVVEIEALYEQYRTMSVTIARRAGYLRDFAAALSHEFKTPLTGLRGGIELLQDHGAAMAAEKRAQFLSNMAGDAARLGHLLTRLMELAQADLQYPDGRARTNAIALLKTLADGCASASFTIRLDAASALPDAAIDADSLERAATILIENARQAGATQMTLAAVAGPRALTLTFTDNGPGIPSADEARIFEPFFTSKRASGGTGLGLGIARSLIEAHGGGISYESVAQGARFVLVLQR